MAGVLGVDPQSHQWQAGDNATADAALGALEVLVQAELQRRTDARAAKDWPLADEVRDRLKAAGITVTDTPTGPEWSLN